MTPLPVELSRHALVVITDERDDEDDVRLKTEKACEAGCPFVQLRMRRLEGRPLADLAVALRQITREHAARLLINDRVDIAMAIGADGVHLPASGMAPWRARRLIGDERVLGRSVHSIDEIRALRDAPIDYLQFGPVFATPSKAAYGPPQGLERLRAAVVAAEGRPVFAVGGITVESLEAIRRTGSAGAAVIGAVMGSEDPAGAVRALLRASFSESRVDGD